tara:strand:+ start:60 stop:224 length:165 start_codon:yes stop_codon:yes gene_type:complete
MIENNVISLGLIKKIAIAVASDKVARPTNNHVFSKYNIGTLEKINPDSLCFKAL